MDFYRCCYIRPYVNYQMPPRFWGYDSSRLPKSQGSVPHLLVDSWLKWVMLLAVSISCNLFTRSWFLRKECHAEGGKRPWKILK